MLEEASDLSSSILQRLHESCANKFVEDHELYDMMDSAGIVFVQCLKQLKRYANVFFLFFFSLLHPLFSYIEMVVSLLSFKTSAAFVCVSANMSSL